MANDLNSFVLDKFAWQWRLEKIRLYFVALQQCASIKRTCLTFIRLCQTNPEDKEAKCQLSSSIYQIMRNLNCTDISWAAFKDHERRISHAAIQQFVPLVPGGPARVCMCVFESIKNDPTSNGEKKNEKERKSCSHKSQLAAMTSHTGTQFKKGYCENCILADLV